jgi:putative peptidoglycan lipid II flippase
MTLARPDSDVIAEVRDVGAAGDSITVAGWTLVSRVTGVVKIAVIGAVLGATFFGNAYQFTNSIPNLIYFGFLAGSLFSSLLVPALVQHIDAGDRRSSERVVGGFLGLTLVALLAVVPLAVFIGPLVLRFATVGGTSASVGDVEEDVARWLILMFVPQVFLYGIVGAATSAMNARRRFALATAAPALENIGTIAVLCACAVIFGTNMSIGEVPPAELLLLGLGTTGAVALHAAAQWWGASRAGVRLTPSAGWRDPEVRIIVRRALPSLAQAGLLALQVLVALTLANRVAGGVVAFQIALNFYFLAIALGATPVALSLLPRLSRMYLDNDLAAFRDALRNGYALGLFIAIPASIGYLGLSIPFAQAVSFGRMGTHGGIALVSASLAALAVAVIAQTAFMIATYASYARKDTRAPLVSMMLQAATFMGVASIALLVHGTAVVFVVGLAFSAAIAVAALHLSLRLRRDLGRPRESLTPSLARAVVGAVVMVGPAWLTANAVQDWFGAPMGSRLGIVAGALVGASVFVVVQAAMKTPELSWLASGLNHVRGRARGVLAEVSDA